VGVPIFTQIALCMLISHTIRGAAAVFALKACRESGMSTILLTPSPEGREFQIWARHKAAIDQLLQP
jgi:hypothetical protein